MVCGEARAMANQTNLTRRLVMAEINLQQLSSISNPAELIRKLLRNGHTYRSLAEIAQVTQPTICRILSGRIKEPKYSTVIKLFDPLFNPHNLEKKD